MLFDNLRGRASDWPSPRSATESFFLDLLLRDCIVSVGEYLLALLRLTVQPEHVLMSIDEFFLLHLLYSRLNKCNAFDNHVRSGLGGWKLSRQHVLDASDVVGGEHACLL